MGDGKVEQGELYRLPMAKKPGQSSGGYLPPEVGQQLLSARLRKGWTTRELAKRAGVSVSTAHKAEHGESVRPDKLAAIARTLGAEVVVGTTLRWPEAREAEGLEQLYAAAQTVPADRRASAARLMGVLGRVPLGQLDTLITWAALYYPEPGEETEE